MNIHKLIALANIALCAVFLCAKANGQGVSGYTSIDYDENANTIDAYSETDLDGDLVGDYDAKVILTVTDQNGSVIASGSMEDTSFQGFAYVELIFSPTGGSTYTAVGAHKAVANLWFYDGCYYRSCIMYYDDWYFSYFYSQVIDDPWYYYFRSPGFQETHIYNPTIPLGTTYDDAQVTVTAPHPFNFHQTNGYATTTGTLYFEYNWSSSTGNKADLAGCVITEYTTYPGTDPKYTWPSPPFYKEGSTTDPIQTDNPTLSNGGAGWDARLDGIADEQRHGGDMHGPYSTMSPAFSSKQRWGYKCPNVNNGKWVFMTNFKPIVRSIKHNTNGTWQYTVTKSGISGGINPLP